MYYMYVEELHVILFFYNDKYIITLYIHQMLVLFCFSTSSIYFITIIYCIIIIHLLTIFYNYTLY